MWDRKNEFLRDVGWWEGTRRKEGRARFGQTTGKITDRIRVSKGEFRSGGRAGFRVTMSKKRLVSVPGIQVGKSRKNHYKSYTNKKKKKNKRNNIQTKERNSTKK